MIVESAAARILFSLVFVYLGLYLILILAIDRIVFLPQIPGRTLEGDPSALGVTFLDVRIQVPAGPRLHGWFIAGSREVAVLFCHGNAGNISHRLGFVQRFQQLGIPLLVFDYRGYGQSGGSPDEPGVYADSRAAWEWLRGQGYAPEQIILVGHSLGGAVAAELSLHVKTPLLVLQSTFASMRSIGSRLFPYKLWAPFIPNRYDTAGRLPSSQAARILIAHDAGDSVIPAAESEALVNAAGERGEFFEIRGGGHNNVHQASDWFQKLDAEIRRVEEGTPNNEH